MGLMAAIAASELIIKDIGWDLEDPEAAVYHMVVFGHPETPLQIGPGISPTDEAINGGLVTY